MSRWRGGGFLAIAALALVLRPVTAIVQDPVLPTNIVGLPIQGEDFTVSRLQSSGGSMPMSELQVSDHVVKLKRGNAKSQSSMYINAMRSNSLSTAVERPAQAGTASLISVDAGQVFLAPVTVGGQQFDVVVDTGSSDPWLVIADFVCINMTDNQPQNEYYCGFGKPYNSSESSTYQPLPTENFNITYADQEQLNGLMGYESFTMGGLTVPHQEFAMVNYATWLGDGYSSGLVGFAYSVLTNAYNGTNPQADQSGDTVLYNPLFVNMYNLSLIAPIFALAIDRNPNNGGLLALGGIPDIPHSPDWISTPIISVGFFIGTTTPAYEFYSITVNGFGYSASPFAQFDVEGTGNKKKVPIIEAGTAIVDSGTSLLYAPNDVAQGVALAFDPPGTYDAGQGLWFVDCNAIPPTFGVDIGGKMFFVNGADLIVPAPGGTCTSGVQPKGSGMTILGDVWMKNVICVFDIGAEMMRFSAREYYTLQSQSVAVST